LHLTQQTNRYVRHAYGTSTYVFCISSNHSVKNLIHRENTNNNAKIKHKYGWPYQSSQSTRKETERYVSGVEYVYNV